MSGRTFAWVDCQHSYLCSASPELEDAALRNNVRRGSCRCILTLRLSTREISGHCNMRISPNITKCGFYIQSCVNIKEDCWSWQVAIVEPDCMCVCKRVEWQYWWTSLARRSLPARTDGWNGISPRIIPARSSMIEQDLWRGGQDVLDPWQGTVSGLPMSLLSQHHWT